jgi:CheY-like chemotaxis protein
MMKPYVLMLQADEDDISITESIVAEMQGMAPIRFIEQRDDVKAFIQATGMPAVFLINNQDHRHKAITLVRHLKADEELAHIPVVVLGEITTAEYMRQYYRAGTNTYITKPSSLEGTKRKIRLFFEYWFDVAEVQLQ